MHKRRLVLIIAVGLAWTLGLLSSGMAQGGDGERGPSIVVRGTGETRLKPDMAEIRAGVVTRADTAAAALDENSKHMAAVLAGLAALGIAEADIQTSNFTILPQYSRPAPRVREEPKITGYHVTNQVTMLLRNLDRLGETLDKLVRLGSNQIQGVQFSISNPEPLLDQARVAAVKAARHKAELLSQAAGVKLGRVLSIQETGSQIPRPVLARSAEAFASVPIAPGQETLSVNVTIVFALD